MESDGLCRGEIVSLVWLLTEHGEALEADFQRYYGLDLLDLWRGRLSARKASVLARQLPYGAQTWISCGFDNAWSAETHLTASLFDAVNVGNWQRAGDKHAKRPTPVQRPSGARESAEQADRHQIRAQAFLDRQRRKQDPPEEA